MNNKIIASFICLTFLSSCEIFDIHPYDGKIEGEKHLNRKNIEKIEQSTKGKDKIRFAVISDTQRWFDEFKDEVKSINSQTDIDFVIHCGDITDFGLTKEFDWQQSYLKKLKVPFVVVLGNHDCIGNGREIYKTMFGSEDFSFIAGNTRFLCLDTNTLEYDFTKPIPNFAFIAGFWDDHKSKNTVIVVHAEPFSDEFKNGSEDIFQQYLHKLNNPLFCLSGHGHKTKANDIFDDGLIYYQITCAKYRQYYIFTIDNDHYNYETIDF